jgi:hypothetical protein
MGIYFAGWTHFNVDGPVFVKAYKYVHVVLRKPYGGMFPYRYTLCLGFQLHDDVISSFVLLLLPSLD